MVTGLSLASSVLFLHYRDLNQVWEVALNAGFFLAPIVYPLNILPERFHFYLYLWPPTPIIQFSRSALVAGVIPTLNGHLLLGAMTAVIFGVGVLVHRHYSPTVAEHV
jgi:lipopolysaccharide transport system permease protein